MDAGRPGQITYTTLPDGRLVAFYPRTVDSAVQPTAVAPDADGTIAAGSLSPDLPRPASIVYGTDGTPYPLFDRLRGAPPASGPVGDSTGGPYSYENTLDRLTDNESAAIDSRSIQTAQELSMAVRNPLNPSAIPDGRTVDEPIDAQPTTQRPVGLSGKEGSYGEGIRQRLMDIHRQSQKDVADAPLAYDLAEAQFDYMHRRFSRGRAITDDLDRLQNVLSQVAKNRTAAEQAVLPRAYAAIAAPDPTANIKLTGTFGDSRDSAVANARDFVGAILSKGVSPTHRSVNLAAAVEVPGPRFQAKYDDSTLTVHLRPNDREPMAVHELGHWLEYQSPSIRHRTFDFYDRRTAGAELTPLGDGYDSICCYHITLFER